jgi:hypothetical protein
MNGTYACVSVSQEITVSKQLGLKDVTLRFFKDFLGKKVFKNSVAGIGPRKYLLISMPMSDISFCQYLWFIVNLDIVDVPCLTGVEGIGHAESVTVGHKVARMVLNKFSQWLRNRSPRFSNCITGHGIIGYFQGKP